MTKKGSSEILRDKNQFFVTEGKKFQRFFWGAVKIPCPLGRRNPKLLLWERVKFGKFHTESEQFSETGGNLKQRGNSSLPQRVFSISLLVSLEFSQLSTLWTTMNFRNSRRLTIIG